MFCLSNLQYSSLFSSATLKYSETTAAKSYCGLGRVHLKNTLGFIQMRFAKAVGEKTRFKIKTAPYLYDESGANVAPRTRVNASVSAAGFLYCATAEFSFRFSCFFSLLHVFFLRRNESICRVRKFPRPSAAPRVSRKRFDVCSCAAADYRSHA